MPCLRHKSLVWAPASDSARMAMICSSVNLLFLMTPPSRRSPIITGSGSGGQVITMKHGARDPCKDIRGWSPEHECAPLTFGWVRCSCYSIAPPIWSVDLQRRSCERVCNARGSLIDNVAAKFSVFHRCPAVPLAHPSDMRVAIAAVNLLQWKPEGDTMMDDSNR